MTAALTISEARHRLENLFGRYAELADEFDAEGIAELFHGATVQFGSTTLGNGDEVRDFYTAARERVTPGYHLLHNIIIDPAGDGVRMRCRYSRVRLEDGPRIIAFGSYSATARIDGDVLALTSFTVTQMT